jgi:WD40 repeat protein
MSAEEAAQQEAAATAEHAPSVPATQGQVTMELEHVIGFNGISNSPMHVLPHSNGSTYLYSSGGNVVIADLADPHSQSYLHGHKSEISCLAVGQCGNLAVSGEGCADADAIVWDVHARTPLYRLQEHDRGVAIAAFAEDDRFLLTVGARGDNKMVVWDLATGCIVATKKVAAKTPIDCACWGGRKKNIKRRETTQLQLATGSAGALKYWTLDPAAGSLTEEDFNTGVTRNFTACSFSDDAEYVFAGSSSGDFTCQHVRSKIMHSVTSACSNSVLSILALPAALGTNESRPQRLVIGGGDGSIALFEGDGRSFRATSSIIVDGGVCSVQLLNGPHGAETRLLVGTQKGSISEVLLAPLASRGQPQVRIIQECHCLKVLAVSYAPNDSSLFATASADGTLRLWDGGNYAVVAKGVCQVSNTGEPLCLGFTGEVLFSGWEDGRLRAHDAEDGALLWTIDNCHRGGVYALTISNNGKFIVTGGEQGEVRCWELRTREMIRHLKGHAMAVTSLQMAADDSRVFSASRDRSILCWDLMQGVHTATITQRTGGINALALLPPDERSAQEELVSVGQEKRVSFWHLRAPEPLHVIDIGAEQLCVVTSEDGRFYATAGTDCIVRLWDCAQGNLLVEGTGHSGEVRSLAFSPDGRQLLSVGNDGNVLVWNIYT